MEHLKLLSRVVPAFGALTKTFLDDDSQDDALHRDAQDCYADIVGIGLSLSISQGEWASGLDHDCLTKLMAALESRLPKMKRSLLFPFLSEKAPEILSLPLEMRAQFPRLSGLADSIDTNGWSSPEECSQILTQTCEKHETYMGLLGPQISLFHKEELRNAEKRNKFMRRLRMATKHLLDIYCTQDAAIGIEAFSLPQHPSHGMKEIADKVYFALQQHWRCNCSQRRIKSNGAREARLSLTRHRQMGMKIDSGGAPGPAKFEVVLPLCKDDTDWKVTNIEVRHSRSSIQPYINGRLVDNDVCRYLRESDRSLQVDFVVEHEKFWHLKPELLEDMNQYSSMESLRQYLGNGVSRSYISTCKPQDQLLLCYILANSMLYLYPSWWIQTEWDSSMLYFIRASSDSQAPLLGFPYMAVELRQQNDGPEHLTEHMQSHIHPAILALGIMFLEIMTGKQFSKSTKEEIWQRRNEDTLQARRLLDRIERHDHGRRTQRIPSGLLKATRRCLKLEPPSNFPSNQLAEEGPIRHYILSCIVAPLINELQVGYGVKLGDIHAQLAPPNAQESYEDSIGALSRRSTALDCTVQRSKDVTKPSPPTQHESVQQSLAERREACTYRDREEAIDESKQNAAEVWFEWHNDACARINSIRSSRICSAQRVKVAILDSGIELSERSKDVYNFAPEMLYKNWLDDSADWRDDVGHGTHLSTLVRRIAPNAVIHIHRVFKKKPTKKSAAVIAKAIEYSVDQESVDMIVMSFGFGEIDDALDSAIQYAASKGVLMFAAASNDGKNRPDGVAWPASDPNVICVHSGDGNGTPSPFTPEPQDSMRLMVLGECIKSAWPERLQCPSGKRLMSGTSCSAPIAAGIAALVLDYSRGFLDLREWSRLRRVHSIRKVFDSMSKLTNQNYRWVTHWTWFDANTSEEWIQGEIRRILR